MEFQPDSQENMEPEQDNQENVLNEVTENEELGILEDMTTRNRDSVNLGGDPSYNITIDHKTKVNWWINQDGTLTSVEEPEHVSVEGKTEGVSACHSSEGESFASSAGALQRQNFSLSGLDKSLNKIFSNKLEVEKTSSVEKEESFDYSMKPKQERDENNEAQTGILLKLKEKKHSSIESQNDKDIEYVIEVSEALKKDCFATKEINATEFPEAYLENEEEYILTNVFIHVNEISFDNFYWNKKSENKCNIYNPESSKSVERASCSQTERSISDSQPQIGSNEEFYADQTDSSGEGIRHEARVIIKATQLQEINDLTSRIESHCMKIRETLRYTKQQNENQILPELKRINKFCKNTSRF